MDHANAVRDTATGIYELRVLGEQSRNASGKAFPGSPAEKAGLRPGDRIIAIDGQEVASLHPFYEAIVAGHKNVLELTVEQSGSPPGQRRLKLVVGDGERVPERIVRTEDLLGLPLDYYPICFLVVGTAVLLLRPDDRNAWLLAVLFGGFLADAPLFEGNIPPLLRGFAVFYKIAMMWSSLALFYYFFAVFPASSPIDRKIPWRNMFFSRLRQSPPSRSGSSA